MGRALLLEDTASAAPDAPERVTTSKLESEHQDGRVAEPCTLQPIPTASSLGTVSNPFRTLTTATQPREVSQTGRTQTCALDYPLLSFSAPGALGGRLRILEWLAGSLLGFSLSERARHEADLYFRENPSPRYVIMEGKRQKEWP